MQRNSRLTLLMQRGSLLLKEKGLLCRGEFVGGAASLTVRIQRQLLVCHGFVKESKWWMVDRWACGWWWWLWSCSFHEIPLLELKRSQWLDQEKLSGNQCWTGLVRSCWCRGAAGVEKELLLLLWPEDRASYYWKSKLLLMVGTKSFGDWEESKLLLMVGTKSFCDWEESSCCWKEDEASAEGMTGTVVEKKQPVAEQKTGVCRQLMKNKMLLMLCRDEVTMVFLVQSCSSVMIQ